MRSGGLGSKLCGIPCWSNYSTWVSAALEQSKPRLLTGWNLHLLNTPLHFTHSVSRFSTWFSIAKPGFISPAIILASLLEGSNADNVTWPLQHPDWLKNICLALMFWVFLQWAAFLCFSSLLCCMQHIHHDLETILHVIKFNYLVFFISKLNNRRLRECSLFFNDTQDSIFEH